MFGEEQRQGRTRTTLPFDFKTEVLKSRRGWHLEPLIPEPKGPPGAKGSKDARQTESIELHGMKLATVSPEPPNMMTEGAPFQSEADEEPSAAVSPAWGEGFVMVDDHVRLPGARVQKTCTARTDQDSDGVDGGGNSGSSRPQLEQSSLDLLRSPASPFAQPPLDLLRSPASPYAQSPVDLLPSPCAQSPVDFLPSPALPYEQPPEALLRLPSSPHPPVRTSSLVEEENPKATQANGNSRWLLDEMDLESEQRQSLLAKLLAKTPQKRRALADTQSPRNEEDQKDAEASCPPVAMGPQPHERRSKVEFRCSSGAEMLPLSELSTMKLSAFMVQLDFDQMFCCTPKRNQTFIKKNNPCGFFRPGTSRELEHEEVEEEMVRHVARGGLPHEPGGSRV